mgnify:CR=1 FL=1
MPAGCDAFSARFAGIARKLFFSMVVLVVTFLVVLLDQLTKELIRLNMTLGDHIEVVRGFFNIRYVQNQGAAFGMLQGFNGVLVLVSFLVLTVIVFSRRSFMEETPAHRIAMGLMISGICGNLADRIRLGFVVDFLDFHWGVHHFWAFNVADSAICIGVGLYAISQFKAERKRTRAAKASAADGGEREIARGNASAVGE